MNKRINKRIAKSLALFTLVALVYGVGPAFGEGFYNGKALRLLVGYGPGSGPDIRGRLVARHIGKHIPGQPRVIVQNMPGAGGIVSTNYTFNVAKPDGLTLLNMAGDAARLQLGEKIGVRFDVRKFGWIGSLMQQGTIVFIHSSLPYRDLAELKKAKNPLIFPARAVGSGDYLAGKGLEALGVPVKIVAGYGTAKLNLAFAQGEVEAGGTDLERAEHGKARLGEARWIGSPDRRARHEAHTRG